LLKALVHEGEPRGSMKIALLGLPGAGKTSVARLLAAHYSLPCLDVDDMLEETSWGCSVAQKVV